MRLRTGVVELRTDFALDLLRANLLTRARAQVEAALLLDPDDATALALEGWVLLGEQRPADAMASLSRAREEAPWSDLVLIIEARACQAMGDAEAAGSAIGPVQERIKKKAPPEFVYREKWGRYDEVHTLPAVERALIPAAK